MAISYSDLPGRDIRDTCFAIADLIQDANSAREAVSLIVVHVLQHHGFVYGMSEKARRAEQEELKKQYGITFPDRQEIQPENGLMTFRREVIRMVKKECDVLAEIRCDKDCFEEKNPRTDLVKTAVASDR